MMARFKSFQQGELELEICMLPYVFMIYYSLPYTSFLNEIFVLDVFL
jgi:hypothetical protein